ncbi:MAG: DUF4129 domain-containing protein [Chloroflexi bacterium]|nr:DUF4129 domain-containing protein [Chloroflexota bacterium]
MNSTRSTNKSKANPPFAVAINFLLIALMMGCLGITVVQVGERLVQGWNGAPWVVLGMMVSLEGLLSQRLIRSKYTSSVYEGILFHITEWVVILVGIKAYLYLIHGFTQLGPEIAAAGKDFISAMLSPEYLTACFYALAFWALSFYLGDILNGLEENPETLELERLGTIHTDRARLRKQMVSCIFIVGAGMLLATALVRMDLTNLKITTYGIKFRSWPVVLYFLFGLILLGQTHYTSIRSRWFLDDIPVVADLAGKWLLYSLVLLGSIAGLAILLPTQYSLGFLEVLRMIVETASRILIQLQLLLFTPFILFLHWLASLFGATQGIGSATIPPAPPPAAAPPAPIPWIEFLKSLIFWILLLGVICGSIIYYFRQRNGFISIVVHLPLIIWLRRVLKGMLAWIVRANRKMITAVQKEIIRYRRSRKSIREISIERSAIWRHLLPRQQIIRIYLELIRQAGRAGVNRRPSQTPHEYAEKLRPVVPELQNEVDTLTNAFVEARYSRHEVTSGQVAGVFAIWRQIRDAFRRKPIEKTGSK